MRLLPLQLRNCRTLPRRRGLTLPEALISLSISATLLTAMATAFVATTRTMTANNEYSSATQVARAAIGRMERDIRYAIPTAIGRSNKTATGLHLDLDGVVRTYNYDATAKTLTLKVGTSTMTLANNITACKFIVTDGTNSEGDACISQVGITLTCTVGKNAVTLSGSATPRRNLKTTYETTN